MNNQLQKPNRVGRPPCLDEAKRRKIVALVANGSSRRVAAQLVGCTHSTITQTALRDPEFAGELDAAARSLEAEMLQCIRRAARKERHWRAAAWLIERGNPHDFAVRKADSLSDQEIVQLFLAVLGPWVERMPDDQFGQILDHIDSLVGSCREEPRRVGHQQTTRSDQKK